MLAGLSITTVSVQCDDQPSLRCFFNAVPVLQSLTEMRLPDNAVIAREKLTNYLLIFRTEDDKSHWLATAGYTSQNPDRLEDDLRSQILSNEVTAVDTNAFGEIYIIEGELKGPNGKILPVRSVWLKVALSGLVRFVTLYPSKKGK